MSDTQNNQGGYNNSTNNISDNSELSDDLPPPEFVTIMEDQDTELSKVCPDKNDK